MARAFQIHLAPRLVTAAASQTLLSFVSSLHFNEDEDFNDDEQDDDKGYEGGVGA